MSKNETTKYDLEQRLIEFAVRIIDMAESFPKTFVCKHLSGQLVRSGTSPALNYAEAQAAASKADFIHKMKICLKELRETKVCLEIIKRKACFKVERLEPLMKESNELISIFVKNINTAKTKEDSGSQ